MTTVISPAVNSTLAGAIGTKSGWTLPSYLGGGSVVWTTTVAIVISLLIFEQSLWRYRRGNLPGKKWQIPIIGQFASSLNPTMEGYKASFAHPVATVSVFNIFIVIASTTDYARRILNSSTYAEPCLVKSAKDILLPENWVFLNGKAHNEYRKGLNWLFTRQALSIYLKMQERIYNEHFDSWVNDPNRDFQAYQMRFRDLNMETSLRVFCGDYITAAQAKEVSDKYWLITQALELVNFPFAIPGTKVWKACRARDVLIKYLTYAADESKRQVALGKEADCLLDQWVEVILASRRYREDPENSEKPNVILREYSSHEMALVLFSFIFASQDAMSSAITFGFQDLVDHPDVLAKIREEQMTVRGGDVTAPLTLDLLDSMTYTNAVAKEVLRHRPPVIMVPYTARKTFPLDDNTMVPKGAMIIPSFWNSLHDADVYPEPEDFVPERFMPGGVNENGTDVKNWLVFGHGAHKCIGQSYVMMHLTAVLGSAAILMDFEHKRTPESDDIKIIATLFPKDGCLMKFSKRQVA